MFLKFLSVAVLFSASLLEGGIVIGHRGASGYLPEHTLAGVTMAHEMGVDFVGPDVVLTYDGVPIVLHDIYLDLTSDVAERYPDRKRADGSYYAIDFSLAEIKKLRIGERRNPDGSVHFPQRFSASSRFFEIPTLQEYLDLVQGLNQTRKKKVGVYVEIKEAAFHALEGIDVVEATLNLVRAKAYCDLPLYVQSFESDVLKRIRRENGPSLQLVLLLNRGTQWTPKDFANIASYANGVGPAIKDVLLERQGKLQSTGFCESAHAQGLMVHPYTVRADDLPFPGFDVATLQHALWTVAKVDGVFSDFPDLSIQSLQTNPHKTLFPFAKVVD